MRRCFAVVAIASCVLALVLSVMTSRPVNRAVAQAERIVLLQAPSVTESPASPSPTPESTYTPTLNPTPTPTISLTAELKPAAAVVATTPDATIPTPGPNGLTVVALVGAILAALVGVGALTLVLRRGKRQERTSPKPMMTPPPVELVAQRCLKCGTENKSAAKFCKKCGQPLQAHPASKAPSQPVVTKPLPRLDRPLDERAGEDATRPLAALQIGTLIGTERYRVIEVIHQSKLLNRYVAEEQQPVLRCSNCNTENPDGSNFCQECGGPLGSAVRYAPRRRIKEVSNLDRFRAEYEMAGLGLAHSNLVPPREAFVEQVNGTLRYYVVLDEVTWETATQISQPQELPVVLGWGIGLADGLVYLHAHRIVLGKLNGNEVAFTGKVAQWADFETAQMVVDEEWQQSGTQLVASDVRNLSTLLYRVATGFTQFDPNNRLLPPKVHALFAKALNDTGYFTAEELASALREAEANLQRPSGIDVHVACLSDVGQERRLDEDSILTLELDQVYRSASMLLGVYAVADGMGGHESGDIASRLAIRVIARRAIGGILTPALTEGASPVDYETWIKESVQEANQAVLTQRKSSRSDMGTTLVMAVISGETAYIAHVGDSRAYLIRDGAIQQLTVDHSLVERLIATKQITREEAATHPQRNVIYKNLGDKSQVEPDITRQMLAVGDRLLLCCDGLSGEINSDQILQIVTESSSLPEACQRLVRAANEAGGHDNISVVLIGVTAIN